MTPETIIAESIVCQAANLIELCVVRVGVRVPRTPAKQRTPRTPRSQQDHRSGMAAVCARRLHSRSKSRAGAVVGRPSILGATTFENAIEAHRTELYVAPS